MFRTCVDCDGCKSKDLREYANIGYHTGWDSDPVDGRRSKDYTHWQFCEDCVEWLSDIISPYAPKLGVVINTWSQHPDLIATKDFEEATSKVQKITQRLNDRKRPSTHPDLKVNT